MDETKEVDVLRRQSLYDFVSVERVSKGELIAGGAIEIERVGGKRKDFV